MCEFLPKYWTIQHLDAWHHALKVGYIEGDSKHIAFEDFDASYQWMKEQMKKEIADYRNEQPVWLWLKKPDMRHSGHHTPGTKIVRLTLQLNEEDVLVSDFEKWHCILNNEFCSDSEIEDEKFRNGELSISKQESWERIFELNRSHDTDWWGKVEDSILQGTTGRIDLKKVISIENFTAR